MIALLASLLLQGSIPAIEAETLAGKEVRLPQDLTSPHLMVVGFQRDHDDDLLAWVEGMGLKEAGAPPWYQLTVLHERSGFVTFFIDNWMKAQIGDEALREKVVMIYEDRQAMANALGLSSDEVVGAMVVAPDGDILARAEGTYTEEAGKRLLAAASASSR
ncbi:MAG: hypothetical protein V2I43_12115 [Parvularcula sp.]|jgi:hypothetical protein|nr:hypothetical protein [Parvularcula sp.]